MEVRALGPLDVVVEGAPVDVGGDRARRLLAALALHAPHPAPAERLIELVWPDDVPGNPANALQAQVAKLRRRLPPGVIDTRSGGYGLLAATDVARFERSAFAVADALAGGDHRWAAGEAAAALGAWRGRPFAELDHPDVVPVVSRLDELRRSLVAARPEAELSLGHAAQVAAEAETAVAEHPTSEHLWAILMRARYQAGRQADALRAFQDARRVLGEELGLEPGPELRELEAMVLGHDEALRVAAPATAPARLRPSGNLPADVSRFVGRRDEEAAVASMIATNRLVTLVGPGGAGKTRLSIAVARRAEPAGGAWFVELAPVIDRSAVPGAVAAAMGLGDARDPSGAGISGAVDRLIDAIVDREVLLVLDNCEHVVDGVAKLVDTLLRACPRLVVLASSREGLGVTGEMLWPVPPLRPDDAVELFLDRAVAISPTFDAADPETAGAVAEICERLDRLPLAIELAAARIRVFPLGEIRARLDDRFRLLTGGSRAALPRQQTLRAVVDWSYELLDRSEKLVFERLSVFVRGCTLDAAVAVVGGHDFEPDEVADLIARLIDKSLVLAVHSGPQVRYRQLQTLALYAREKLADSGNADEVRERHARWYTEFADQVGAGLRSAAQDDLMERLADEIDNVRAALDHWVASGRSEEALTVTEAVAWHWWLRGELTEAVPWFDDALAVPCDPQGPRFLRVRAWRGWYNAQLERPDEGLAELDEVVGSLDRLDDEGAAVVLLLHANCLFESGRRAECLAALDGARARAGAIGFDWVLGLADVVGSLVEMVEGRRAEARALLTRAAVTLRRTGDSWVHALVLNQLAELDEHEGDYQRARERLTGSLSVYGPATKHSFRHVVEARLGNLWLLDGDPERADEIHRGAVVAARQARMPGVLAQVLLARGFSHRRRGELDEATAALEEALSLYGPRQAHGRAFGHSSLGFVHEVRGDAEAAERAHREALAAAVTSGDRRSIAFSVEGLAGVAALRGDGERAAFLLGVGAAARRQAGTPLPPAERFDVGRIEEAARRTAGSSFDDAFARGARAPLDGLVRGLLAAGD